MTFTRSQLIIIGSAVFIILLGIGIFTGILPGARRLGEKPPEISITIWGIDDQSFFQENIADYEKLRPNVHLNYEEINPATYEKDLVDDLASGKGPDIIMFHNSWLPKHFNKILAVDKTQFLLKTLQELYPTVIEQDFSSGDEVYALPLYIDTLALFYNQDAFDKTGIALSPKDWLEFQNLIPRLRQKDTAGKIVKAAAAIGGSNNTINNGSDLLALLMLQAGAKMTDDEFTQATFAGNISGLTPGLDALTFYLKFSDPNEIYYTWNENLEYSLDGFARGNTAMMFNYNEVQKILKEKNPFLNFQAAALPQPTQALNEKAINYPNYWGLAVTNNSKNPAWAWDAILFLTANEKITDRYLQLANRPPSLRSLIQKYVDHPKLGVFAKQALSARSWPQIDRDQIAAIFSQMISAALNKNLDKSSALLQAEREVTELMRAKR